MMEKKGEKNLQPRFEKIAIFWCEKMDEKKITRHIRKKRTLANTNSARVITTITIEGKTRCQGGKN